MGVLELALVLSAPEQPDLSRVRGGAGGTARHDRLRPGDGPGACSLGSTRWTPASYGSSSIGIGVLLPPIGVALFIACAIAKLSIVDSAKFMAPYLVILFLGLLVITYVPWFTLVLPRVFLH